MDIKKYIASGILEQYVLDLLSDKERKEVESYMLTYPAIKAEVDNIETALETYADLSRAPLPPGMEQTILNKIKSESSSHKEDSTSNKTDQNDSSNKGSNGFLNLLLGLLLLGAIGLAAMFYNNNQTSKAALTQLQTSSEQAQSDCDRQEAVLNSLVNELRVIRESGNKIIQLTKDDNSPPIANIHYNKELKKTYLDILNLPPPPTGKQYQLWAIVEGKPVDMNVFNLINDPAKVLQEVPFIENPQAFAITLEKEGGSPTPDLEALVAITNV